MFFTIKKGLIIFRQNNKILNQNNVIGTLIGQKHILA